MMRHLPVIMPLLMRFKAQYPLLFKEVRTRKESDQSVKARHKDVIVNEEGEYSVVNR